MQEKMENYELDQFKVKASMVLAFALIAVGGVMLAILTAQGQAYSSPLYVIAVLLLVAGIPLSFVAERIEKHYDIDTIREVRAFLDGAEPDQIERDRKMPKAARVALQVLAGVAGAIVFMTIVSLIIGLTMFD